VCCIFKLKVKKWKHVSISNTVDDLVLYLMIYNVVAVVCCCQSYARTYYRILTKYCPFQEDQHWRCSQRNITIDEKVMFTHTDGASFSIQLVYNWSTT